MQNTAKYDGEEYDYIVIGAGSAGSVVAARLAQAETGGSKPFRVLLLEAGDAALTNPETLSADGFIEAFSNDKVMLDRLSVAQPRCGQRNLYMGSGTGMGGSGAVNGMVYTRGDQRDYARWPPGWQWQDVSPCFEQVESVLGVQTRPGSEFTYTALKAATEAGFQRKDELNDGDLCGYMGYQLMNFQGERRRSSYAAFLHDLPLDNLTLVHRAQVQRIIFNDEKKAVAVEYTRFHGRYRAQIRKELIVCAGALESPKLLMLSGVGDPAKLKRFNIEPVLESRGIGNNLQDHPNVCVFFRGQRKPDTFYPQLYGFERMNPRSDLAEDQPDTCFVFYSAAASIQQSMQRMLPAILLPPNWYRKGSMRKGIKHLVNTLFLLPFAKHFVSRVYGIVVILGKPESRGDLDLASTNAADPARINPGYFLHNSDLEIMVNGVLQAQKIANQPALMAWGNKRLSKSARTTDRDAIKKWIRSAAMTTFHYAGTCRMGEGVADPVDTRLRVKGLANVRVADASAIPDIPVAALNAPSMMIGWRAADFILQDAQLETEQNHKTRNATRSNRRRKTKTTVESA